MDAQTEESVTLKKWSFYVVLHIAFVGCSESMELPSTSQPVWCRGRVHTGVQQKPSGNMLAVERKAGVPGNGDCQGDMHRALATFVMVGTHFLVFRI